MISARRLAALATLSFGAAAASATVLPFSTGFEAAQGYTNNAQLAATGGGNWTGSGQDASGWLVTNQVVGGSGPKAGTQWVLASSPTAGTPARWQWTVTPVTDFSINSTVNGSCDVKLVSPATGTINRSTIAGIQMYDAAVNVVAQMDLFYDAENAYGLGANRMILEFQSGDATGFAYDLGAGVLNAYANLALSANFQTNTLIGYFNGVALPDVGNLGGATDFDDFDMVTARALTTTGGTAARAGFDNYSINVSPTPGASALLGLAGLAAKRRRR